MKTAAEAAVERVIHMERLFDTLQAAWQHDPCSLREDDALRAQLNTLTAYLDSGQWLADYALDEQGAFSPELKRGVLSEDGLYNFLLETHSL